MATRERLWRVTLSADKSTVIFQAGATLGQLVGQILTQSNMSRAFPIVQRPTVGMGYVLGGGFGALTRYAGLGADQVISMNAVDSSGRMLVVNATTNSDLFWALRGGGGGNLVIVTGEVPPF
jgi:FAD/FMN-containing dehydrogenase